VLLVSFCFIRVKTICKGSEVGSLNWRANKGASAAKSDVKKYICKGSTSIRCNHLKPPQAQCRKKGHYNNKSSEDPTRPNKSQGYF
jgi:ribosomal protein L40E